MNNTTAANLTLNVTQTEQYEIILQATVLVIVLIIALLGNGFVCTCILKEKHLQIPTNFFIFSLSSADLLFALLCLPLRIYYVLKMYSWDLGLGVCQFWVCLDFLFCSASIANLAAISVDRYLKISSPLTYDTHMTKSRVTLMLALLWGYSIVLASFSPIEWSSLRKDQARGIVVENGSCYSDSKIYLTIVSAIGFFAPLSIMLLMYCVVFKVAVNQAAKLARQHGSVRSDRKARRKSSAHAISLLFEVKATKTLIILLSAFCICWCPFFVLIFIGLHSPKQLNTVPAWCRKFFVVLFVYILPNCNAALDPIIYTTQNQLFRKAILKIFKAKTSKFTSVFSDGSLGTRKPSLSTREMARQSSLV